MIKYRTLESDGDYSFGKNDFLTDIEATAQAIKTRMFLLLGEWWENTDDGLPLFQSILGTSGSKENKNAVDLIISERISGTKGVEKIVTFKSAIENRNYTAELGIDTVFGSLKLSINNTGREIEVSF